MTMDRPLNDHISGCYCCCHSPFSSCPACEHCEGDNPIARRYQERMKQWLLEVGDAAHYEKSAAAEE